MRRIALVLTAGLACAGCRTHQRVELVNATPGPVTVTLTGSGYYADHKPRADLPPGGRFKYVSSDKRATTGELRATAAAPGPMDARRLVGEGTFRGWIRQTGGTLVIEEAEGDLPSW
jgi:hypothetical protein